MTASVTKKPIIEGEWRIIGPNPKFSSLLPELNEDADRRRDPNDHCIFQSPDGRWHLWACVRWTEVGRLLCHWEAGSLNDGPWEFQNEWIRADRNAVVLLTVIAEDKRQLDGLGIVLILAVITQIQVGA